MNILCMLWENAEVFERISNNDTLMRFLEIAQDPTTMNLDYNEMIKLIANETDVSSAEDLVHKIDDDLMLLQVGSGRRRLRPSLVRQEPM